MDNLHTRTYMMRIGRLTEQTTQSTFGLNERSGSIAEERRKVTNQREFPMDALLGNTTNSYSNTVTLNFKTREELCLTNYGTAVCNNPSTPLLT